jgi:hypothetical protein
MGTAWAGQGAEQVLSLANSFRGTPYVWAGIGDGGFDCSGFVHTVMKENGYNVPRMADEQFYATTRVAREALEPGDLVFFTTYLPGPSHVGIYQGNGKFVHASSAKESVVVSDLSRGYYAERFIGGGRPAGYQPPSASIVAEASSRAEEGVVDVTGAIGESLSCLAFAQNWLSPLFAWLNHTEDRFWRGAFTP